MMNIKQKMVVASLAIGLSVLSLNAAATSCGGSSTPPGGIGGCDGTGVNFNKIGGNSTVNVASQLDLKMTQAKAYDKYNNQADVILFTFRNVGNIASSITGIYFDDVDGKAKVFESKTFYNTVRTNRGYSTVTSTYGAMSVYTGQGTNYAMDTVVKDLPSVNDSLYGFGTNYSADSVNGTFTATDYNDGVNQSTNAAYEYVTFMGLLRGGHSITDLSYAINHGDFIIGLNVATKVPGTNCNYDSYTFGTYLSDKCAPPAAVPLPSAVWLFGSALIGFVSVSNRRRI